MKDLSIAFWMTVGGIIAGLIFIILSQQFLDRYNDISFTRLNKADASKIFLIIGVMTVHSFTEGVSVVVSFLPRINY